MNMNSMKRLGAFVLTGILLFGAMGIVSGADTTEAVHFSKLIPFLPKAPRGWEGEEPFGIMVPVDEGTCSMATKSYTKSGVTASVMIMDYAFYQIEYQAEWETFHEYESTEGYAKSTKVNGFPAWEVYDKDLDEYSLIVGINDRFMVFIGPSSDKDTLYAFSDRINYKGIAALGGGVPPDGGEPSDGGVTDGEPSDGGEEAPEEDEPGFEAIFAIAGLLAVAYLVKRKRRRR
jgi:PGF-CTERM protein